MRPYTGRPIPNLTADGAVGATDFYAPGSHAHPEPQCPWWPIEHGLSSQSLTGNLDTTTRMYLYQFFLPGPLRAAKAYVYINIAGSATQKLKVALYDADGQRVLDAWEYDCSATGRKTHTFATAREIPRGFYYFGFTVNESGTAWGARGLSFTNPVHPSVGYVTIASAHTPPEVFDPRAAVTQDPALRPFVTLSAY